ncbi:hypothetical protein FRB95_004367 [Tulasnella sp. JGI-2019a]|nr:hypothetical protein FRB93_013864 [Tulasnella sp. JGI-2019a]KAG9039895.1 hypothetical protein FRB95_004367 [Tulasnella sp. JGI-2019a]
MPRYNLPSEIAYNLGPYSARYVVDQFGSYPPVSTALPNGCEVTQVNILHRHGARLPVTGQTEAINLAIGKVFKAISKDPDAIKNTPLSFLSNWQFPNASNSLVDFGREQGYVSGVQTAQTYQDLARRGGIFIRTTNIDRVLETSRLFRYGFNEVMYSVAKDTPEAPDIIIPVGTNNTLSCKTCKSDKSATGERIAMMIKSAKVADQWLATYAPPIAARLQSYLPGLTLTDSDVRFLMSLCGFETAYLGEKETSPWCTVFSNGEWLSNEYWYDLEKYWGEGYGNPLGRARGSGWVNELVARLTGSSVSMSGCVNRTLDTDPATFPLPPNAPSIFADFSSDNNMAGILSALGILHDDMPLPPLGPPPADRLWVASKLVPFATKLVVEKISCDGTKGLQPGQKQRQRERMVVAGGNFLDIDEKILSFPTSISDIPYVRIILNDAVVPMVFAGCGDLASSSGICHLDAFVAAQAFSTGGGEWDELCTTS